MAEEIELEEERKEKRNGFEVPRDLEKHWPLDEASKECKIVFKEQS